MGSRARRRDRAPESASPRPVTAPAAAPTRERPPWHPVPLTELCVLIGLVLLVWGLIRGWDDRGGRILLVAGMALGSLGGLEAALRDHFSGTRSHATVLAALPAVLVAGALFLARAPWLLVPAGALVTFAAAFAALRAAHRRRSL